MQLKLKIIIILNINLYMGRGENNIKNRFYSKIMKYHDLKFGYYYNLKLVNCIKS